MDGFHNLAIAHFITYIVVGIPIFAGVLWMHGRRSFFEALGLDKGFTKAVLIALVCTLPMLLGYASVFPFNQEITLHKILLGAVGAALFEELYFRGFLFGQVFQYTPLGFIPSIFIGAGLFASVHLYQSQDPTTLAGIFATTFMGAVLFAWVFTEWNANLWVPIFLHLFMNLFWLLFSAGDNALGGVYANIFRAVTIALVITGTIVYKRKNNLPLSITRRTLWLKR